MDKILEEAMTNMIRRIEDLEKLMSGIPEAIWNSKQAYPSQLSQKIGLASEGQIKYIRILKGRTFDGMTKQDAGIEIDRLLKQKEENSGKMVAGAALMDPNIKDSSRVVEPEEVDTEDAGIDEEDLM